jgi:renalase
VPRPVAPVVVVGGGIAGVACARTLADGGVDVVVHDRGRRIGGRMARVTRDGRAVDVGASYLTARGDRFAAVVDDWRRRGLARPWTDTFHLVDADGLTGTTTGPMRWAAPGGLRSLVEDLATGLAVRHPSEVADVGPGTAVDGRPAAAVVLAMPDPQAVDLLAEELVQERAALDRGWEPALALVAAWEQRRWPDLDGAFVQDSPVLTWLADDGRRRGDGAPVLVAHSTPVAAAHWLDEPGAALIPMLTELRSLLRIDREPRWAEVRRWSLATPGSPRDDPYLLTDNLVGACGDGWGSRPRVEGAYASGRALGEELVRRLR